MSYYKFSTLAALAAWDLMEVQEAELKEEGDSFAKLFSAQAVFKRDFISTTFFGVKFPLGPYLSADLWTKPTAQNGWSSTPKRTAPAGMRQESKALNELWEVQRPKQRLERDPFYQSIGLDWSSLFMAGCAYFRHNDVIYIETSAEPKPEAGGVEILGSEFKEAKKASIAPKGN